MKPYHRHKRSFALIITLAALAIISILLVGFVLSMKTERLAASAMADDTRAKMISQLALQHAIALLDNNIPDEATPGKVNSSPENWSISPGLLTKFSGPSGNVPTYVSLSTSTNSDPTAVPKGDYVNLNAEQLSTQTYPIVPTGQPVPMNWVYVTQNPTLPPSSSNPIIGRYAFWMDDENAKININTAYGKPQYSSMNFDRSNPLDQSTDNGEKYLGSSDVFTNTVGFNSLVGSAFVTNGMPGNDDVYPMSPPNALDGTPGYTNRPTMSNPVGNLVFASPFSTLADPDPRRYYPLWHPTAVNIGILPTGTSTSAAQIGSGLDVNSMADWVYNLQYLSKTSATQNWRLLQDPSQVEQFVTNGSPSQFYQANKFNLTAYNRAPEFNVFGKPRLLMEARIQTAEDTTASPLDADTSHGNYSGTELMFYNTPDLDPTGPMYFHGYENIAPYNGTTSTYTPDYTGVQMVGDYLSQMLNVNDWPGMPQQSFANKWSQGFSSTTGQLEADQVAWNIVSLGNYAANMEGMNPNVGEWPDDNYSQFSLTANTSGVDKSAATSPTGTLVSNQAANISGDSQAPGTADPNRVLRVGFLSNKAVLPFNPRPWINEVALQVTAYPVATTPPNGTFYLQITMNMDLYVPLRGPPGTYWSHFPLAFGCTHFFTAVSQTNSAGNVYTVTQGASPTTYGSQAQTYLTGNGFTSTQSYPSKYYGANGATSKDWFTAPFQGTYTGLPTDINNGGENLFPVNTYPVLETAAGHSIFIPTPTYASSHTNMVYDVSGGLGLPNTNSTYNPFNGNTANGSTIVNVQALSRVFVYTGSGRTTYTYDIAPVWDTVNCNKPTMSPPAGQTDSLAWNFSIDLSQASSVSPTTYTRSVQVPDARLGGNSAAWKESPNVGSTGSDSTVVASTLGSENQQQIADNFDPNSYSYLDFQAGGSQEGFYCDSPRPSIGFLSCVPNGMQRGIVNSTLVFGPTGASDAPLTPRLSVTGVSLPHIPNPSGQLPDWLLLDLLAPSFADNQQPSFAPYSYLHSTMGKINLNANLYPTIQNGSNTPLQRWLPLQALLANMDSSDATNNISSSSAGPPANGIVSNIMGMQLSPTGGGPSVQKYGAMAGTPPQYDYIGELCEVQGVADGANTPNGTSGNSWEQMALIRNLANLVTTQSNTFHVWGAAQAVKVVKAAGNTKYGVIQPGDNVVVTGEKRFESVVERSVWPGVDGVPGNGHVNGSGAYDQKSSDSVTPIPTVAYPWAGVAVSGAASSSAVSTASTATWSQIDGPDNATTLRSTAGYPPTPGWYSINYNGANSQLINANNPARAHMYYKPIMFRYVTE